MTLFQNTWHHLRRSPFQTITAFLVMFICFFCLNTFAIISRGLSTVLLYFETKPEVTIFLKDGLDRNTIDGLQKELADYPNVKEIKYISKEKALSIYKEQNKANPLLTEMVTSSILPASFEVSVSDPLTLDQVAQNFSAKTSQIDEIIYQKDLINSLLSWTSLIRKIGLIIISTGVFVAFLIISAIISLKATNRRDEVKISRLLGASKFYVHRPFLLEGAFYGLFGSIAAFFTSGGIFLYFRSQINSSFQPIEFIGFNPNFILLSFSLEVFFGLLVGYLASWFAVRRHIKF